MRQSITLFLEELRYAIDISAYEGNHGGQFVDLRVWQTQDHESRGRVVFQPEDDPYLLSDSNMTGHAASGHEVASLILDAALVARNGELVKWQSVRSLSPGYRFSDEDLEPASADLLRRARAIIEAKRSFCARNPQPGLMPLIAA